MDLVREKLQTIPAEDQKLLADFFRGMLSQGDFTATLLGDKPAFMNGWTRWQIKDRNSKTRNFVFLTYSGCKLWQKYAHLFPKSHFSFIDEGYRRGCFGIWFVKEFQKDWVEAFLQQDEDSLKAHETIGLLLGYPRIEVENFCKEVRVLGTLKFFPYEDGASLLGNSTPLNSSELLDGYPEDLLETLNSLKQKETVSKWAKVEPFFPTITFRFPFFSEDGWEQKIADLYNSGHFLEDFLTLMVKE